MKRVIVLFGILAGCLFFVNQAVAGGVDAIGGIGTRAKGMGGAGIAIANDAASFYYNPALLVEAGNFAQAGFDIMDVGFDYKSPTGEKYKSDDDYFIPLAGVNYSLNKRVNIGLGLVTPYMLGSDFKQDLDMFSEISLTNVVPAVAWRATDNFSVGAAVKMGFGQIELTQPIYAYGMKLGKLDNNIDGWGYSWQIGALWKPYSWLNLGATYQSRTKVELDGDAKFSSAVLGNASDDFSTDFYFPARYGLGIGVELGKWLIAADIIRFNYSSTDHCDIDYDNWIDERLELEWEDNTYYGLGVEYALKEQWKLRTGIAYQDIVIPDETVNPVTPDVDGWCASVGLGYQAGRIGVDLAYLYAWGEKRTVNLPHPGAGEYDADINIYSVAVNWSF